MKDRFLPAIFLMAALLAASPAKADGDGPAVVELFTAQGCADCPPVDAYFAELAERSDIVALAYHVDTSDNAVYFSGKWKDPFSKPEWTEKQKSYAERIPGAGRAQAPQVFIDGRYPATDREEVEEMIKKALEQRRKADYTLTQGDNDSGGRAITLKGDAQGRAIEIALVRFADRAKTKILSGANKGTESVDRHIMNNEIVLGTWYGSKQTFHYSLDYGFDCAIILRDKVDRRIEKAAYCSK